MIRRLLVRTRWTLGALTLPAIVFWKSGRCRHRLRIRTSLGGLDRSGVRRPLLSSSLGSRYRFACASGGGNGNFRLDANGSNSHGGDYKSSEPPVTRRANGLAFLSASASSLGSWLSCRRIFSSGEAKLKLGLRIENVYFSLDLRRGSIRWTRIGYHFERVDGRPVGLVGRRAYVGQMLRTAESQKWGV